jgi:VPDSG-CTERM motif
VFATIPGNHLLEGLAVHGSDVFVTTALTNPTNAPTIFKISPGRAVTPFGSFLGDGFGIAFNAAGDLFAADSTDRKIFEFAPNGHRTTFVSGIGSATRGLESGPADLAFDNKGNLFTSVSNLASAALGEIVEISPSGAKSLFVSGLGSPRGLAFDSNGNLFVGDRYAGKVFEFSPTGMETVFASGFLTPEFLAFAPPTGHGVPDSGTTAMLLGSALAVMALLRARLV